MYLLYLDESGNEDDPRDKHFVLAGLAVFERSTYFLSQRIDQIQARHLPGRPPIPFHASAIRAGKDFWRGCKEEYRTQILEDFGDALATSNDPGVVLFAAVVEKSDQLYGEKVVEYATETICRRFDTFLARRETDNSDPQRGLLIFSEGRFDQRAKLWVRGFRELDTRWGTLRNLSDIPYFASMKDTRLLQAADFIAHSVFLLYERRDPTLIRPILSRFNQQNGTLHGLVHYRTLPIRSGCECPACFSRETPSRFGSWI